MASPRDHARLRQGPNSLTTSPLGPHSGQQPRVSVPPSTSSLSMASSHPLTAHATTSAIQPYNPQQWVRSEAPMLPERPARYATAVETRAPGPPPPPYSPPRSRQQRPVSTAFEHVLAPMSTPPSRVMMNSSIHPQSPESLANPSFPPPPGAAGRSSSRDRRFGFAALGLRSNPPDAHSAVSTQRIESAAFFSPVPQRPVNGLSIECQPPASRRAASTGAINTAASHRSRSTSQTRWEPGMPLPPPPPGPPPFGPRSQSSQGTDRNAVPVISPPTRRPPPSGVTSLGPVPPTPADWVDSDAQAVPKVSETAAAPDLTIDTGVSNSSIGVRDAPGASKLNRTGAVRHEKTILQRRSESRHLSQDSLETVTNPHTISDIFVPKTSNRLCSRLTAGKSTPLSAGRTSGTPKSSDIAALADSRNSTPRGTSAQVPDLETATPPFSPLQSKSITSSGLVMAPKALPTPPPHKRSGSTSQPRDSSRPPPSAGSAAPKQVVEAQTRDQFAASTIERFQEFANQESAAASDADRVRLFADFIVNESRLRRERYASAIAAMGSEIFDLTRDLFRPLTNSRRESATSQEGWTPSSVGPGRGQFDSGQSSASDVLPNSSCSSANPSQSPTAAASSNQNYGGTNYMPSLSPILSMSVSDNHDNSSSRGRPSSRWWETDSQEDTARGWERSKRESKYMGVSKEQLVEEGVENGGADERQSSEYPPEKTGEEASRIGQAHKVCNKPAKPDSCPINQRKGLDVSRLVTLPPPYPRHHPAVSNAHPELSGIRTAVRGLSEMGEVEAARKKYALESIRRREEFSKAASERRKDLRDKLQKEIGASQLGYAEAAAIESAHETQEKEKAKEEEKSEYEHFQNDVIVPMNELLSGRISRATDLLDNLARQLFDRGELDADMPQEEGDDRPELLEKLTLLKWIFETREILHRTIYNLLTDRNARYRDVVLTPYRLNGNFEKLESTERFFATDASNREGGYAHEVLERAREFLSVVEEAVQRGVALQLSAFWDIAPPLRELIDSIPMDFRGFTIQIPADEIGENPVYGDHPMQYLFSLLLHTEKSTYQFIESHTNLLCLLHQVKEAVAHGERRVLETQAEAAGDMKAVAAATHEEAETVMVARAKRMGEEEKRLTEDLKEKVRVVQQQWRSALGEDLNNVKERTREWLLETGGWDENLEEGEFVAREE